MLRGKSFEFAQGWTDVILPVLEVAEREGVSLSCAKEKFGSLRLHFTDVPSDALQSAASAAESASCMTCEECGARGQRKVIGGWVATLCKLHSGPGRLVVDDLDVETHAIGGES